MAEGSKSAAILIAIRWQALGRATRGGQDTRISDCSVMILFAGFYIEATLDYIILKMRKKTQMTRFLGGKKYPGVQEKLGWFYNEYVASKPSANSQQMYANGIKRKLRWKFPGFARLYKFRNSLSHGVIDSSAESLQEAQNLRKQAKAITAELYAIASDAGYTVPRVTTYQEAIAA